MHWSRCPSPERYHNMVVRYSYPQYSNKNRFRKCNSDSQQYPGLAPIRCRRSQFPRTTELRCGVGRIQFVSQGDIHDFLCHYLELSNCCY